MLNQMTYTKNIVSETLRMHSIGMMIRKPISDLKMGKYTIPKSYNLAVNPGAWHYSTFSDPDSYIPERWDSLKVERFQFLTFGSGPAECPGKSFAIYSTMIFLITLFGNFDLKFVEDKFSQPDHTRLIGIPHPTKYDEKFFWKRKK